MMVDDLTELVRNKFSGPARWSGFDLLSRCATDPPLAIETLVSAAGPQGPGPHRICELGFGSGWLLEELARAYPDAWLYGLDQSASYVAHVRAAIGDRVTVVRGDIESLPFRNAAFDVVVTCWTLYFMRDLDQALNGIRRCLRPGGRLVAATVAPDHMLDHEEMVTQAVRDAGSSRPPDSSCRFDLGTGVRPLRERFGRVELREWHGVLTVADVATALELWDAYPPDGVASDTAARARTAYGRIAAGRLAAGGPIRVRRHDGAFVVRRSA